MQFPFFNKKQHQFIYTLLVSKKTVGACVWHVEKGAILVDGISDLILWDEENEDSLYDSADKAVGSLGEINATQVLLSLPDDWVQGQNIHPKRKGLLRALTEKLELSSVGFVVTMEAVIASLKEKSTTPLNLVCACVEPDAFIMAIVTQSQSSPILRIGRSDKVTDDFLEGCSRLKISGVPPQMCIISLSESEQALSVMKQELEGYQWDPSIFVQSPTIRLESPAFVLSAVTQAGGNEVLKAMPELRAAETAEEEEIQAPEFTSVHSDPHPHPEPVILPSVILDAHTDPEDTNQLRSRRILILPVILGVVIIGLALCYFVLPPKLLHANLTIKRKSTTISGDAVVTVQTDDSASSSAVVRGALLPINESGEIEVPTTGQKKTGESASGTVTLFNLTSASKQFKSGTSLKTGKLSFVTNEDVTVASASTGANYEKIPGKANVKTKASAPGEESNIGKDLEFSVGGFDASAFIGRSESAFSGGTSRTVASVTQKDQDAASVQLTKTLEQKIADDVTGRLDSTQDGFLLGAIGVSGKKYSKAVGDEASSVSLSMNASASAMVYSKLDALAAASSSLNATIPVGAKLDQSALTISRTDVQKLSPQSAKVSISVNGKITLPVDASQFASITAGKSIEDARTFLDNQASVATYNLTLSPAFLTPFIKTLPTDASKITVTIVE